MHAAFYQGRAPARSFPAPVVVGMRPGYIYRVELSEIPGRPGLTLFPTLELRGALHLPPKLTASSFPATVHLSDMDVEAIARGSLITKLIYLENPDRADPRPTRPGEVIETDVPARANLFQEARERGRAMILVHVGERVPMREELVAQNVPGTILLPGARSMGLPTAPPAFPPIPANFFDPFHGPRLPEEECLHDGGDRGPKAVLDGQGQLHGLDPEDTIAEFTDSKGRRSIACSNRVCLCVPRFAVLRKELPLAKSETVISPSDTRLVQKQLLYEKTTPSELALQYARLQGYQGRLKPGVNINEKGPGVLIGLKVLQAHQIELGPAEYIGRKEVKTLSLIQQAQLVKQVELVRLFTGVTSVAGVEQDVITGEVSGVKRLKVVSAEASVRDITVCCNEAPHLPDKPLFLTKCADRSSAQVGDVVTFSLRYSNVGGRPITDVAVSDSLSGRLEYVEGSAEADRDAVFTIQENEAGSAVLRWEIGGRLLPGQSGRLRFKARVR